MYISVLKFKKVNKKHAKIKYLLYFLICGIKFLNNNHNIAIFAISLPICIQMMYNL